MITALRTSLRSVTLNTDVTGTTATKTATTQQLTAPALSADKLRTLLNSSRASGDPVLVSNTSASTASAKTVNDAIKEFVAIAEKIRGSARPRPRPPLARAL